MDMNDAVTDISKLQSNLNNKLDKNQEAILALNELISQLKNELKTKIDECNARDKTIQKKDDEITGLNRKIAVDESSWRSASKEQQEELMKLQSDLNNLRQTFSNKEEILNSKKTELEKTVEIQKKEIGMLSNRLGAMLQRLQKTEDVNRKVLLKSIDASKKFDALSQELANKTAELQRKDIQFKQQISLLESETVKQKKQIIGENTKRLIVLMAQIEGLKKKIEKKDSLLDHKSQRQKEIFSEMVNKFRELGVAPKEAKTSEKTFKAPELTAVPSFRVETAPSTPEPMADIFSDITKEIEEEEETLNVTVEADPSFLEPMVERALEQGDSEEEIVASLVCSGYQEPDIRSAIRRNRN
ncbi:MAG: hypothetical protein ACE5DM_00210 [Candidatus Nanoarchaeia archaeon]